MLLSASELPDKHLFMPNRIDEIILYYSHRNFDEMTRGRRADNISYKSEHKKNEMFTYVNIMKTYQVNLLTFRAKISY